MKDYEKFEIFIDIMFEGKLKQLLNFPNNELTKYQLLATYFNKDELIIDNAYYITRETQPSYYGLYKKKESKLIYTDIEVKFKELEAEGKFDNL
jgi:hypothetical protein